MLADKLTRWLAGITLPVLLCCFTQSQHHPLDEKKSGREPLDEKQYLDTLNHRINELFRNVNLTWDEILASLSGMEMNSQEKFGDTSRSAAFVLHKQGVVYYNKGLEGDPQAFSIAIERYRKSLDIREKINTSNELTPDIIRGYSNIAGCYSKIEDPYQALHYLLGGLAVAESYPDRNSITPLLLDLNNLTARAYRAIGDFDNAVKYYSIVIHWLPQGETSTKTEIMVSKIRALLEAGGIQAGNLDQPSEAVLSLKQAEAELLHTNYDKRDMFLSNVYYNLGIAFEKLQLLDTSLAYTRKAAALSKKTGHTSSLAHNYISLAIILLKTNNIDSAQFYLENAKSLLIASGQTADLPYVYDNQGDIEFLNGNFEESIALDNQVMASLVPDFNPASFHDNPTLRDKPIYDKQRLLISLESKGNTLLHWYRKEFKIEYLRTAYHTFRLASELVGYIRTDYSSDISKLWLAKKSKRIYASAIDVCWELYLQTKSDSCFIRAFEYSEKSRALILLDALRKIRANFNLTTDILAQAKFVNQKVNYFEKSVALSSDENSYPLTDSLLLYRRKYDNIIDRIEDEFPDYYHLIYDQRTATIDEIRQRLSADQSMVEYFKHDTTLFIFAITKNSFAFIKRYLDPQVTQWVSDLNTNIMTLNQGFLQPSYKLYEQLIQPLKEKQTITNKLIVVPDDIFHTISFDALVTKPVAADRIYLPSFREYLIYDHQVSYAFSASTLCSPKRQVHADNEFIGFAPSFENDFSLNRSFFERLRWNIPELREIGKYFSGDGLTGRHASRNAFLERASQYQIIHLATHALANNASGDLSFITFGADSADLLYARDLYALNLNADMVVLSACQTSSGSLHEGEGIISLARGFIYSGASSVITSLWNVREETNKNTMTLFYKRIKEGLSKDEALRNAKLEFLQSITRENQEYAHPFYWASLICVGDSAPYKRKALVKSEILMSFLVMISVCSFFFYRKMRKRQSLNKQ